MKTRVSIALIFVVVMMSAFTCEESEIKDEFVTEFSSVISSELPSTGNVNQEITFIVTHQGGECSHYSGNKTITDGRDVFVTFFTNHLKNQACTKNLRNFETPYTFKPTASGDYTFHFKRGEGEYIIEEIAISE